jgi:uncharacterized protein (TIGR00369 family)
VTDEAKLRRFIDGFMQGVPHLKALGVVYRGHGPGWAELALPYADHLVADPGTGIVASGAIFTLMDSTAGFSVVAAANRLEPQATLDLRLDYLRPARPGATVIGRSEAYKTTRSVVFVRGIAHDGDPERPVAHMTGTFMFTAGASG